MLYRLNSKDALAFAVLRYALGSGSAVKYGSGAGPLGKAAAMSNEPLALAAFNAVYSDSGLFGVFISTTAENAKKVAINYCNFV